MAHPFNIRGRAVRSPALRTELFKGQRLVVRDANGGMPDVGDMDDLGRERQRKHLVAVGSRTVIPTSLYGTTPEALSEAIERFRLTS